MATPPVNPAPASTALPAAFLGVGWAFPPRLVDGDVALAAYDDDVRQAVWLLLSTEPGERVMRPTYGAGLRVLAFEPLTTTTAALVRHRVETALVRWEPRIDLVDVSVTAAPAAARLDIAVSYRVRTTNTAANLVYPFYLLEGTP
jgi:phage baseplate assembly protein W